MLLHVTIRILSCETGVKTEENLNYDNILLINFNNRSPPIYGDKLITSNDHNFFICWRNFADWTLLKILVAFIALLLG
jgi:hypothetical protein